jgi:hypothetical protein
VVAFKSKSIFRIDNIFGDLASVSFSIVTQRYGCVAADTVVDCGSDLLWLSQEGVASLTLTERNEIQSAQGALAGRNLMLSADIGPLIERVNGTYQANAYAVLWEDRYYLALPVDRAEWVGPELTDGLTPPLRHIPVTPGATYRFEFTNPPLANRSLVNGTVALTVAGDFVAQTDFVYVALGGFHPPGITLAISLRKIAFGSNTLMAVYDLQNAAWTGYDEVGRMTFKSLFRATHLGQQRMFVITDEGWVLLWEEGYADRLAVPFTWLVKAGLGAPIVGNTVRVNGGTLVTCVEAGAFLSFDSLWWNGDAIGYNPQAVSPWTAPNTRPIAEARPLTFGAIRFESTNGVVPTVVVTGTWATVESQVEQPIIVTWVSRGYGPPAIDRARPQWLDLDVEVWHPSFTVSLLADGVAEERTLCSSRTKSRTAYYRPWNAPAYDLTNVNHDHGTAHREDYAIVQSGPAWTFNLGAGVRTDLHQATRETFRLMTRPAQSTRVKVVNSTGRLRIGQLRLRLKRGADRVGSRD